VLARHYSFTRHSLPAQHSPKRYNRPQMYSADRARARARKNRVPFPSLPRSHLTACTSSPQFRHSAPQPPRHRTSRVEIHSIILKCTIYIAAEPSRVRRAQLSAGRCHIRRICVRPATRVLDIFAVIVGRRRNSGGPVPQYRIQRQQKRPTPLTPVRHSRFHVNSQPRLHTLFVYTFRIAARSHGGDIVGVLSLLKRQRTCQL